MRLLLVYFVLMIVAFNAKAEIADDEFRETVNALNAPNFVKKAMAIETLANTGHQRARAVMKAMLEGALYYRKSDDVVFVARENDDGYALLDVITNEPVDQVGSREARKISINNQLRTLLREKIAVLSFGSPDAAVREAAVVEIIGNVSEESVAIIRDLVEQESSPKVKESMQVAIALLDIKADQEKSVRLRAIHTLGESLHPEAKGALNRLLEKDGEQQYVENDADIRRAAQAALGTIDTRVKFYGFLETIFFGLSLGSVLLLAAIGLAITFGVMGVINMAHGELIMLGAYTTYVVQLLMPNHIEYSLFVALPLAFLITAGVGILIERGVIRFLYGRPLETLLATFGISLILQQLVRTVFSPLNRAVETPAWMSGSLEINSILSLTYNRFYIIIFSLVVFALLMMILKKTSLGLQVRAVSQNRAMARAMGVRSGWVDALTFGLGSGIAGIAGVALSQLTNVGPNMGQAYIIDSFMVVVFGGVGNLWGTLVGAMSLGVVNKFLEPWSGAVLAKILVLVFIILFIQKRPRGLFPQKGRAAEA